MNKTVCNNKTYLHFFKTTICTSICHNRSCFKKL